MTVTSSRRKTEGAAAFDVVIDIMIGSPKWDEFPEAADVVRRALATVALIATPVPAVAAKQNVVHEIAVLLCDDEAIAALNERWRGHRGPTNVLSFPAAPPAIRSLTVLPLGDIAIAYDTVVREAEDQDRSLADHLAHLAIHGFLHLLGYDHQHNEEAERMEQFERDTLARIGIADPYAADGI